MSGGAPGRDRGLTSHSPPLTRSEAGWWRAARVGARGSRPAGDTPGPAVEGVGGGDAPQPRPRTGRTPRAAAPSPTALGRSGGGAWVPAGPTLPEGRIPGSGAAEARGPQGPRELAAPRGCESEPCRGPNRGGAPNFWPGSAGSAELGQTTKATAGLAWVLARAAEGSAGSATPLRLPPPGTSSGCAARLGEGGRGH